jgi:3-dehydroquinate dehydratase/shikimate dehydrogenase
LGLTGLVADKTAVVGSFAPVTNAEALAARVAAGDGIPFVEVRLDSLREEPDLPAIRDAFAAKTLVATLRTEEEGGRFTGSLESGARLLRSALRAGFDLIDVPLRGPLTPHLEGVDPARVIVSAHETTGVPTDLDAMLDAMERTGARFAKIVGTARDSGDATRLLAFQRRRADGRLAAFAMGEAGVASRVLAPYLGAALAYGSLVPGRETAPGQIPARDLVEVYGIGRKRRVEKLYALFGGVVSHSLSPAIHNASFESQEEPALYVPFALQSLLTEFDPLVIAFDGFGLPLKGASVTIPFKEEAATVAVFRGESVANTLVRSGDAYIASNTDRTAFSAFTPLASPGMRALVLGAGGTARVAIEVLVSRRWDVSVWNRDPVRAHDLAEEMGVTFLPQLAGYPRDPDDTGPGTPFSLLVNATPVGMKADDPLPCPGSLLKESVVVIDAPYRAGGTALVRTARERGARVTDGFQLLVTQAAKQAELFTSRATSVAALLERMAPRFRALFTPDGEPEGGEDAAGGLDL